MNFAAIIQLILTLLPQILQLITLLEQNKNNPPAQEALRSRLIEANNLITQANKAPGRKPRILARIVARLNALNAEAVTLGVSVPPASIS